MGGEMLGCRSGAKRRWDLWWMAEVGGFTAARRAPGCGVVAFLGTRIREGVREQIRRLSGHQQEDTQAAGV